jgi:hypothetical protein
MARSFKQLKRLVSLRLEITFDELLQLNLINNLLEVYEFGNYLTAYTVSFALRPRWSIIFRGKGYSI